MKFARLQKILSNWIVLNDHLMALSEYEVAQLLKHEEEHDNRITFVLRIHSRLTKLRRERERRMLARRILKTRRQEP